MRQPLDDIRAMCAEIDRKDVEQCLYLRWVLNEHALNIISPWLKKQPKRQNFDEFKRSLNKAARNSHKPDRAAFHAAYGRKIKRPKEG